VIESKRTGIEKKFVMPQVCPECGTEVVRLEGETAYRCIGIACPAQIKERIAHFASRGGMDIDGLGDKLVSQLVDTAMIKDPADLYYLTEEKLLTLNRMGEKSVHNLVTALEKSKSPPLEKFINALGIRHVGEHTSRVLAETFMTLGALMHATRDTLLAIRDIGPEVASSIERFFREPFNMEVIEKFRKAGVTPIEQVSPKDALLAGKTFVFTGTLNNLTRNEAKGIIESLGASATESVTKVTDYLVVGESPGSKLEKAKKSGVTIINEDEFLTLIGWK
ncbi:MAG: NAD-dependent DNA ligase LigA, partial [Syntrophaceae bacterium]|nr:NAD-dependent DNA ligase LigA [Syntrophaceae bacterium]